MVHVVPPLLFALYHDGANNFAIDNGIIRTSLLAGRRASLDHSSLLSGRTHGGYSTVSDIRLAPSLTRLIRCQRFTCPVHRFHNSQLYTGVYRMFPETSNPVTQHLPRVQAIPSSLRAAFPVALPAARGNGLCRWRPVFSALPIPGRLCAISPAPR